MSAAGLCGAIFLLVLGVNSREAAAQGPPAAVKQAYARAMALERKGNHPAALSILWEAAGAAPRDADIQNSLGEALERIGALDAAVDAFRSALAARPDFRKAANNLILTLVKAGKGPEAVSRAREQVAAAPGDPDAHFTLGLAQSEQDVEGALSAFSRALELDPRHTLARYNLALVLNRADRPAEAIAHLRRGLEIEPRAEAHYTLGVIYWHQGDVDRAVEALRGAIAANPRYADAHYTLGTVLKTRGDLRGAISALRRAVALRPDLWGAHYTLAQASRLAGDDVSSRAHLAEAERLRRRAQAEQEAGVWTSVGTRMLDGGDAAGAAASFRRAIQVFEAYPPAHYQLARALQRLGQKGPSREAFARAQQLNPSLVPATDPDPSP